MPPVFVVVFEFGGWRVAGEPGRVYGWQLQEFAEGFAARLGEYGLVALVLSRTPSQLTDLLAERDLEPEALDLIEAQTSGPVDCVQWTVELADRLAARLRGSEER